MIPHGRFLGREFLLLRQNLSTMASAGLFSKPVVESVDFTGLNSPLL